MGATKRNTMIDYLPTFTRANNKLCPQGWAWLIGDCDFGQNCGECEEGEAPIYREAREKLMDCDYPGICYIKTPDSKCFMPSVYCWHRVQEQ